MPVVKELLGRSFLASCGSQLPTVSKKIAVIQPHDAVVAARLHKAVPAARNDRTLSPVVSSHIAHPYAELPCLYACR
jgi:hypothetical protein